MLTGLKTLNVDRVNEIHERILKLGNDITFRVFPIYIRYLRGDDMFALLYFNLKEYNELGIASDHPFTSECGDAKWMKYREIKYSIKIGNDTNLKSLFEEIKAQI